MACGDHPPRPVATVVIELLGRLIPWGADRSPPLVQRCAGPVGATTAIQRLGTCWLANARFAEPAYDTHDAVGKLALGAMRYTGAV
jgi:hypothetical protein